MAGYDFFSQPQGPNIDISLYGDAAAQGAAIGHSTPTGLTSFIKGTEQGVETGLDISQKMENINLTRAEAQNRETINQINQMDLESKRLTKESDLQIKQQQAKNELIKAQQNNEDLNNTEEISKKLQSQDPNERASVLTDPTYAGTLGRVDKVREHVLGTLSNDPNQPVELQQKVKGLADYYKQQQLDTERARVDNIAKRQAQTEFGNAPKLVGGDAVYQRILAEAGGGLSAANVAKVKIYPSGLKVLNKDGTINKDKADRDIASIPGMAERGYQAFVNDKLVNVIVDKDTYNNDSKIKSYYKSLGVYPEEAAKAPATPTPNASPSPSATPGEPTPYMDRFRAIGRAMVEDPMQRATPPDSRPNPMVTPPPYLEGDLSKPQVKEAARVLAQKSETDPDLRNRLIAKGLLKAPPVPPRDTSIPVPQGDASPIQQNQAPVASPTPPPEVQQEQLPPPTKRTIAERVSTLSPEVKKQVDPKIVSTVLDHPQLANLDPIHKAIAAVESAGGILSGKNKDSSAQGLFQLTLGAALDTNVDPSNPTQNVEGGVAYFNKILKEYHGKQVPALFGYNLGPGVARAAFHLGGLSPDYTDMVNALRILRNQGRFPAQLGGSEKEFQKKLKYPLKVLAYQEAFRGMSNA